MTIQAQQLAILNDDGTRDKRYTIDYSGRWGVARAFTPFFCNLRLAREAGSLESALIRAKSHQTKQVLGASL
jgi:hypothetical protein